MSCQTFDDVPSHARAVPEPHPILPVASRGGLEGWAMPVATWLAPTGFDAKTKPNNHDHHTLALQLDKAMVQRVTAGGRVLEQRGDAPRQVCLQPAEVDKNFVASGEVRFAHLYFTQAWTGAIATELFGSEGDRSELFSVGQAFRTDEHLRNEASAYLGRALDLNEPTRLEMDARATLLGVTLLQSCATTATVVEPPQHGGLAPWQVKRATEFLADRLAVDVSLRDLAELLDLSTFHLCRAFKCSTGLPPHRWRLARRVERARELLEATNLPITQIAAAVGYNDPSQLAATFRKALGVSPSRYRREQRA